MRNALLVLPVLALLFPAGPARAQPPRTVTATVNTVQALSAGTANFRIQFVDASLTSSVDTALAALSNTGAAVTNLSGISVSISQGFVVTQYDFLVPVPLAQFAAARDRLIAIQRSLVNSNTQALGWSTSFTAGDEERTRALEQALPALLAQARAQAAVLAAAVGGKTGAVQSLTPDIIVSGLNVTLNLAVTFQLE